LFNIRFVFFSTGYFKALKRSCSWLNSTLGSAGHFFGFCQLLVAKKPEKKKLMPSKNSCLYPMFNIFNFMAMGFRYSEYPA